MGRKIIISENEYYHIYNRGVEKREIFIDDEDKERFVRLLFSANSSTSVHLSNNKKLSLAEIPRGETIVAVGAWCLMSNHFHLLLKEVKKDGISTFMKKLLTGYSMYFNKKYNRKGTLFEGPFNAKHLNTDNYLKYQYAYIHLNPVSMIDSGWKQKKINNRKKAKEFLSTYHFSSFFDYLGNKRVESIIIEPKVFPNYFLSDLDFEKMVAEWINFASVDS